MTGSPTEDRNPRSEGLDRLDSLGIVKVLHGEDRRVADVVTVALPDVARAVDHAFDALDRGGRLVYFGAGTSGRLAQLDASEIPPTFGFPEDRVVAVIAGGPGALLRAVEGAEDDALEGVAAVRELGIGPSDCVVGITASGTTRFVLGALGEARERGASTVMFTCGPPPSPGLWHVVIHLETGPEAVAGSTRLKAGTATKMVLNMISTGAMVRLGRVHDNLMVEVRGGNAKLQHRAEGIVAQLAELPPAEARALLARCEGEVKTAVVAARRRVDPAEARALLEAGGGNLRRVLEGR